jgi:hypothetical protein
LAHIRKDNHIALAVASSGIASTLLSGGRTAHSAIKLPINLTSMETPICNISKNSKKATVLKQYKYFVEVDHFNAKSIRKLDKNFAQINIFYSLHNCCYYYNIFLNIYLKMCELCYISG